MPYRLHPKNHANGSGLSCLIVVRHRSILPILIGFNWLVLGWGLLSQFPPFRYFPNFSALSKQTLAIEYHVYIWQVSPQLSWGDICQILMWFEKSYMYFCHIENFAYGENNERSFSNPQPGQCQWRYLEGYSWIDLMKRQIRLHNTNYNKKQSIAHISWDLSYIKSLNFRYLTMVSFCHTHNKHPIARPWILRVLY